MKLIGVALSLLASPAIGRIEDIKKYLEDRITYSDLVLERAGIADYDSYNDHSLSRKRRDNTEANEAEGALVSNEPSTFAAITDYGCWCYFGDDGGMARGEPVDSIDEQCRVLRRSYECAIMDAEANGEPECVPWNVQYVQWENNVLEAYNETLYADCQTLNDDPCAARACAIESYFMQEVIWDLSDGSYDSSKLHANGFNRNSCITGHTTTTTQATTIASGSNGDSNSSNDNGNSFVAGDASNSDAGLKTLDELTLQLAGGSGDGDTGNILTAATTASVLATAGAQNANNAATTLIPVTTFNPDTHDCCGQYPIRYRYSTNNNRQCCGQSTFNGNTLECCAGGYTATIGAC